MQRRTLLAALTAAPAATLLGACSVEQTVSDGPAAPSLQPLSFEPRLALVLAAGGPRGFAHVGVLKALHEIGFEPDLIIGASVGALIGSAAAAGLSVERIEALAFEFDFYRMARWSPGDGMKLDGTEIATLLRRTLVVTDFAQLKTAFAVVATDLASGLPAAFNRGDVAVAVQASCAIPGYFAPVRIRGREFVDADVASPLPVKVARTLGARRVLAVDVAVHADKPRPSGAEIYEQGDRAKRAQIDAEARLADLVLHPYFGYWVKLSRDYRESTARAAYEQTLAQAPAIERLMLGA